LPRDFAMGLGRAREKRAERKSKKNKKEEGVKVEK
jgi:hypothetical protein